jgi:hypothetical protein
MYSFAKIFCGTYIFQKGGKKNVKKKKFREQERKGHQALSNFHCLYH